MAPLTVTPGDDLALSVTLYENGILAVLTGAAVTATIQDGTGRTIVPSAAQSSSATGASWGAGVVVCEFAAANTHSLAPKDAWLEIVAVRSGKRHTFDLIPLNVQRGATP